MKSAAEVLRTIGLVSTPTSLASSCNVPKPSRSDIENSVSGTLKGYDCTVCRNKGVIFYEKDGYEYFRECECMKIRRSIQRMKQSGLQRQMEKCTFDSFETTQDVQKAIQSAAVEFVANPTGWFFIGGQVGCGKSHICTAIVKSLMDKGKEARYKSYEPSAGTIIFFDWDIDELPDHVGIVEKCDGGTVYTVEGNSSDSCKQNSYAVGSNTIYGYGVPAY